MAEERVVFRTTPKFPEDVMHVPGVDFAPRMTVAGEVLEAAEVTVQERETGQDTTAEMFLPGSLVIENNVVSFHVKGGEDRKDYIVRIRGSTNQQREERAAVLIPVRARVRPSAEP